MLIAGSTDSSHAESSMQATVPPAQVYPPGVEFLRQGAPCAEVLYVERGLVKLTRVDLNGRETILDLAFAGAWVGTAAVIASIPSPASAITCAPSLIARMLAVEFRERLSHDPEFSQFIHELNAHELCRHMAWIGQLTSLTSGQRLRRVMRQLIAVFRLQPSDRGIRLRLPLHHWELARLIAVTPEHLCRLLKDLEREGIIRRDKGWVIVTDVQRLCPDAEWEDECAAPAAVDGYQECR
jgi:CRP/FNR family cyclic AMP-dependent transcriptional regulator